ncbi:thioredoxin-like fold protein [Purpureocillium lavendulum]|uniref:Thioredoxin-like fold protein n=1 Tax=Purpureocillium lavendulum TaxID=1247861 RepID=A0AB34FYZ8_9HYPO|nr:thioredoxin-like fold protein [Purpureocillium lavendulum]
MHAAAPHAARLGAAATTPSLLMKAPPALAAFRRVTRLRPYRHERHAAPRGVMPMAGRASFSSSAARPARNQVLDPIRNPDSFYTHLSLSSSARAPLLTLWTASWCPTCRAVLPLLTSLVESGVGEPEGGVMLAPVEFDSPDIMAVSGADNLAMTYMITSVPTLLSFDAGEAQTATRVTDGRKLADRQFLEEWIRNEARRHGGRGGGGGGGGGGLGAAFGGLFGNR